MATVRYIVRDVPEAVVFYTTRLAFNLVEDYGPAMAIVARDDLRLWLAGPASSAAKPMPDGIVPAPGGFARIVLDVVALDQLVAHLQAEGVRFRNEILPGPGGRQVLCLDPSGNTIELFEPA